MRYDKPTNTLSGKNIFKDKKNRTIYYDKMTKRGYAVAPGTENTFYIWYMRYALGFICFVFLELLFFHNLMFSIPTTLGVVAFLEYKYRKLLNTYPMIVNFNTNTAEKTTDNNIVETKGRLLLKAFLYILLGVLLIANVYVNENLANDMTSIVISYIAAAGTIYMGLRFVFLCFKKK